MVFYRSLSDSKSPQVSQTLLSILANPSNTIVWMVLALVSFSFQHSYMLFHWSLSYSKSPQISRSLLSILANFNNAVVWMVIGCPPISNSSNLLYQVFDGVMVKARNCGIVVREFVLQSRYYVHFRANTLGKGMNPLILPPAMGK